MSVQLLPDTYCTRHCKFNSKILFISVLGSHLLLILIYLQYISWRIVTKHKSYYNFPWLKLSVTFHYLMELTLNPLALLNVICPYVLPPFPAYVCFWSTIPQILCYSYKEVLTFTQIWQVLSYCKHRMLASLSLVYLAESEYVLYLILSHPLAVAVIWDMIFPTALSSSSGHHSLYGWVTIDVPGCSDLLYSAATAVLAAVEAGMGTDTPSFMGPSRNSPQESRQKVLCM